MKEKLIAFETAKLAKEKGFDVPRYEWYDKGVIHYENREEGEEYKNKMHTDFKKEWDDTLHSAPTQTLLAKWLRDVHNIDIFINKNLSGYFYQILFVEDEMHCRIDSTITKCYLIYEDAMEIALFEGLKLIK